LRILQGYGQLAYLVFPISFAFLLALDRVMSQSLQWGGAKKEITSGGALIFSRGSMPKRKKGTAKKQVAANRRKTAGCYL
jgi:hypothetical protein